MVDYDQSRPDSFEPVTFGEWQLHQYNGKPARWVYIDYQTVYDKLYCVKTFLDK